MENMEKSEVKTKKNSHKSFEDQIEEGENKTDKARERFESEIDENTVLKMEEASSETPEEEEVKEEVEAMPEEERKEAGLGIMNWGFAVQEWKSRKLGSFFRSANHKYLKGIGETYRQDEIKAKNQIKSIKELRAEGMGSSGIQKLASSGYITGNAIRFGRAFTDITGISIASPLRWFMMGSMVFARGAEGIKKAEEYEVSKTTRIEDEQKAYDDAWDFYNKVDKKIGDKEISAEDLKREFTKELPEELLNRLKGGKKEEGVLNSSLGILQTRIKNKIENIDKELAGAKTDEEVGAIMNRKKYPFGPTYAQTLNRYDKLITKWGDVNKMAMAARWGEVAGKTAIAAVTVETLAQLAHKAPEVLSDLFANIWGVEHTTPVAGSIIPKAEAEIGMESEKASEKSVVIDRDAGGKVNEVPPPAGEGVTEEFLVPKEASSSGQGTDNEVPPDEEGETEELAETIPKMVTIEKGGSVWSSAKRLVSDKAEFYKAWTNSMVEIPGSDEPVHISKVDLVHSGTTIEYIAGENGKAGRFEIKAPKGGELENIDKQTEYTEKIKAHAEAHRLESLDTKAETTEVSGGVSDGLTEEVYKDSDLEAEKVAEETKNKLEGAHHLEVEEQMNIDIDKLYGSKDFFGFGTTSGVDSTAWQAVKNLSASEIFNAERFEAGFVDSESEFVKEPELEAKRKMRDYLYKLSEKSELKPDDGEKVESFIRRALTSLGLTL